MQHAAAVGHNTKNTHISVSMHINMWASFVKFVIIFVCCDAWMCPRNPVKPNNAPLCSTSIVNWQPQSQRRSHSHSVRSSGRNTHAPLHGYVQVDSWPVWTKALLPGSAYTACTLQLVLLLHSYCACLAIIIVVAFMFLHLLTCNIEKPEMRASCFRPSHTH